MKRVLHAPELKNVSILMPNLSQDLPNPLLSRYPASTIGVDEFTKLLHHSIIIAGVIGHEPPNL
jgi:hypothetical protein